MVSALIVGDNAGPFDRFNTPALIDSPAAEQAVLADRLAGLATDGAFDPEGLYVLEVSRDEAYAELAGQLAASVDVAVTYRRRLERRGARAESSTHWIVSLIEGQTVVNAYGTTAAEATANALAEWEKARRVTRTKPECRQLLAETGEAFGVIDPLTVDEFRAVVEYGHGRSDFLAVEADGRVVLNRKVSGWVGPEEAHAIGGYVAKHNAGVRERAEVAAA